MKNQRSKNLVILISMVLLAVLNFVKADTQMKPTNYSDIKELLDAYALADDMMDEKLITAREAVRSKGDEAVPALILLFKENPNDQYRAAIVDALQFNRGKKLTATTFLAEQLSTSAELWQGQIWIASAIRFIATKNPELGRGVALKALDAQSDFVKQSAIRSLAEVGTTQDAEKLRVFREQRRSLKQSLNDGVVTNLDAAIERITERSSSDK